LDVSSLASRGYAALVVSKEEVMQAGSFGLVGSVVGVLLLAIVLGITLAAPLFAVLIFIPAFGAFLLWRGTRRSQATLRDRSETRVPMTEEASADPIDDSAVPDVMRAHSDARIRHERA
jgi:hypothetical protein